MTQPPVIQRELLSLIEQVLEDRAKAADAARLESLLLTSGDARDAYVAYLDMHVSLQQHQFAHFVRPLLPEGGAATEASNAAKRRWRHNARHFAAKPGVLSLAIATLFLLSSLALLSVVKGPFRGERAPPGVMLTAASQCRFVAPHVDPDGHRVFVLAEGIAQLSYPSGVKAVLSAPAHFVPEHGDAALLAQGRVVVKVPPQAHGYAVDTPLVRVVDLGTQFALDVADDGTTEVHVSIGRVRIEPLPASPWSWQPVELGAGQSLRVGRQNTGLAALPAALDADDFTTEVPVESSSIVGVVIHDRPLKTGPLAIDPPGAQQITDWHAGGRATREALLARNDFGVVQDWRGFVGCGNDYRIANVLTFSDGRPHVEFKVTKLHGDRFSGDYGSASDSLQHATSGDSFLGTGFNPASITATHTLSISFGTLAGESFIYDRAVTAACFTLNNINGGTNSTKDTTRYCVSFLNAAGKTLYRSQWVDVNSPKSGDADETPRPNVYFAHQVPSAAPRSDWIARIVITEQRRGGIGSGNQMGFDDFGFASPPEEK